eukprot:gnl/Spiro4/3427_TR1670_c0_g2_i1.p1 gnl/Spiro4/3427_TR1670_c0_g2~~gnl/Spiro4/3427_TR1670_c0_g2_i1.p1  ORF type:complete len:340 (+),score=31.18 gnl/Spiro4/3427_TR1670_c0_g2_i1:81-1100(+)
MALRDLVMDPGCSDGQSAGRNPLSEFMHSFIESAHTHQQIRELQAPPAVALSAQEQTKVRNRASVMARQFYPDQSEEFVGSQVERFLVGLRIGDGGTREVNQSAPPGHSGLVGSSMSSSAHLAPQPLGSAVRAPSAEELVDMDDDMREFLMGHMGHYMQESEPEQYIFAEDNPYMTHESPLLLGEQLFQAGNLHHATLAFEAELQRHASSSSAWRLLGACKQQCDDDRGAMTPLLMAVEADVSNLTAVLDLAVCFTNELRQSQAMGYLKKWLQQHPVYGSLVPVDSVSTPVRVTSSVVVAVRESCRDVSSRLGCPNCSWRSKSPVARLCSCFIPLPRGP